MTIRFLRSIGFLLACAIFFTVSVHAAGISAPTMQQSGYGLGARFGFSSNPSEFGKASLSISFNYNGDTSTLAGFRLYEKKPGEGTFTRISEFTNLLDVGGAIYRIAGNFKLGRVSGTNGWLISRIIPGNQAGAPFYGTIADWPVGVYSYYIMAIDSQGGESAPSQTSNAHMMEPLTVLYPIASQSPAPLIPTFRWTIPAGWSGGSRFDIRLYDGTKEIWVGINPETNDSKKYDGPALTEGKTYTIHIHGDYASYYSNPLDTYFSLPRHVETFMVSAATPSPPAATPPPASVPSVTPSVSLLIPSASPTPTPTPIASSPVKPTATPMPKHSSTPVAQSSPVLKHSPTEETNSAPEQEKNKENTAIPEPSPSVSAPRGFFPRFFLAIRGFFTMFFGK